MSTPQPTSLILVIEADDDLRAATALALESGGFEVVSSSNGRSGIDAAQTHKPHLILLGLNTRDMFGFEVLTELKQNSETREITVIAISSGDIGGNRERAEELGVTAWVTLPWGVDFLRRLVQSTLDLHGPAG